MTSEEEISGGTPKMAAQRGRTGNKQADLHPYLQEEGPVSLKIQLLNTVAQILPVKIQLGPTVLSAVPPSLKSDAFVCSTDTHL